MDLTKFSTYSSFAASRILRHSSPIISGHVVGLVALLKTSGSALAFEKGFVNDAQH